MFLHVLWFLYGMGFSAVWEGEIGLDWIGLCVVCIEEILLIGSGHWVGFVTDGIRSSL
jgi:hypothetical protein